MVGLPMYTKGDVLRLKRRVARVQPKPEPEPYEPHDCGDHRHASRWVGPYLICRCLRCPVLVVGGTDAAR